jgi:ubiquinone biosynthesis protein
MFRQVSHLIHLARAGLAFARYDVIPPEQIATAPAPARLLHKLAKWLAGKPKRTGRSGLNAALEELGPSYIKLGQFLATRPDFVGKDRANELSDLQDKLDSYPQDVAEAVVEKELGKPIKQVFSRFGKAVAAASIAQVHKAKASDSDRELAVKILRPNVKRRFKKDLDAFFFAARMAEKWIEPMRRLRPVEAISVLARSVDLEMDLRMEAAAMAEMAENTKDDAGFYVPQIDWQRTTGRVLTSQWIDGIALNAPEQLEAAGVDLKKLAENVIQSFLRHAIRDGFFHADMHQGNLFVDKQGNLVAVDFGITGRLSPQDRQVLAEVLYGFIQRDYLRVSQVHFDAGYVPADQDVYVFAQSLRAIGEPIMDKKAEEISMGHLLGQLLEGTERFAMQTQPQLILLQKTMIVVEGVARSLDPQFNMWTASEPVVRDWIERRLGPAGLAQEVGDGAATLGRLAIALPQMLTEARSTAQAIGEMAEQSGKTLQPPRHATFSRSGTVALWIGAASLAILALAQIF